MMIKRHYKQRERVTKKSFIHENLKRKLSQRARERKISRQISAIYIKPHIWINFFFPLSFDFAIVSSMDEGRQQKKTRRLNNKHNEHNGRI
jgi:hypothetical protein